jgi:predicted RNA-binding Zn-ribbon protein involved in translation (DUF1610 family)
LGRVMVFLCNDCGFHKTIFSGSGMHDDIRKQKELYNCPKCGCISLRTVHCVLFEDEGVYVPAVHMRQKCSDCNTDMIWAESGEMLTCPQCNGNNCIYFNDGVWD